MIKEAGMKKNARKIVTGLAAFGLLAAAAIAGPLAGHPHLKAARRSINKALADCQAARADEAHGEFGGHRDRAEELLTQAKGELDAAAEYADTHR